MPTPFNTVSYTAKVAAYQGIYRGTLANKKPRNRYQFGVFGLPANEKA